MRKYRIAFLLVFTLWSGFNEAHATSYSRIDSMALKVPLTVEENIKELVPYLTKDMETFSDKIRAIAMWIVYDVDFDDYKQHYYEDNTMNNIPPAITALPDSGNIFYTRKGTSFDYANLFKQMAELAGFKAAVIKGYYKGYRGSNPVVAYKGANYSNRAKNIWYWNAVSNGNEWFLIDTAAAATGVSVNDFFTSRRNYEMDIKWRLQNFSTLARNIQTEAKRNKIIKPDSDWFFPKPSDFINTHFPLDSSWQLLNPARRMSTFFD